MHYVYSCVAMNDEQNTFNAKANATTTPTCATRKWATDRSRHNCHVKIHNFTSYSNSPTPLWF